MIPEEFIKVPEVPSGAFEVPVMPLRDLVVFPSMVIPLFVGRSFSIKVIGTVRNVRSTPERTCLGVKFDTLGKKEEEHIRKFILEEQRKTLKLYKTGEPTEGSSS